MYNNSSTNNPNPNPNPSKTAGLWHSTKGEVKQGLGRTFASADLEQLGREERLAGEAQYNAARAQDVPESTGDRLAGKTGSIVGGGHGNVGRNQGDGVKEARFAGDTQYIAPAPAQGGIGDRVTGNQDPTLGSVSGEYGNMRQ